MEPISASESFCGGGPLRRVESCRAVGSLGSRQTVRSEMRGSRGSGWNEDVATMNCCSLVRRFLVLRLADCALTAVTHVEDSDCSFGPLDPEDDPMRFEYKLAKNVLEVLV